MAFIVQKSESISQRRRLFVQDFCRDFKVVPDTLEIVQLAGSIEGEQATKGIGIPFEDLVIGSTALYLGFDVLTHNAKHFQLIPGLNSVTF
jgi:predicted nucleic acid-binding protein